MADTQAPTSGLNSRYLNAADLRRLRNVFFTSRRIMEGMYAGRHVSPMRGHSTEFSDYRPYMPGDEITDIDWKVFGRSDKLVVKLFEHHSDMTVNLVLDASASMAYTGTDELSERRRSKKDAGRSKTQALSNSKYDHACRLAAAIAFMTSKQQDKVSLAIAQQGLHQFARPLGTFSHLTQLLRFMETTQPDGRADLPDTLRQVASMTGRRGVLIVLSDLLDDFEQTLSALGAFTHRGNEVILFHILHADELKLPDLGQCQFVDSETQEKLRLNIDDVQAAYQRKIKAFTDKWSHACKGRGIDYNLVSTSTPSIVALEYYLFARGTMV